MRGTGISGVVAALLIAAGAAMAQPVTDYLGLPGPIGFDGQDYTLAWSSAPSDIYVKQEYLPPGQALESYDSMVLVEFVAGDISPAQALAQQVAFLDQRRTSDPITNYQVIQNPQSGEILLDFVVSARDANGEYIIEWNGYRYAQATDRQGRPGVVLFAISQRAYGNAASQTFLEGLATFKDTQVAILGNMPIPWP